MLMNGMADLLISGAPPEAIYQEKEERGFDWELSLFAVDGLVFLVNADNPVDSLTVAQIQEIYMGQHTSWSDFGGTPQALTAYQRPHGSGSQTAMEEMVMRGLEIQKVEENYISDGMADAVAQIGNYDNGPGAIGYSYLYYVNTLVENSGIKTEEKPAA